MNHTDSSALAAYNSLADPHLQCYFSNERIRSHLRHAGLISRRGEIISDNEYRLKLARREHKKHVRQMLAENIVHRAIDMERARQAELKRQLDMVAKVALVNSVKESKMHGGYPSGNIQNPPDMGLLSMDSSWSQMRPKSASHPRDSLMANEEFGGVHRVSRVHSAHVGGDYHAKYTSKSLDRRRPNVNRPKSSSAQRSLQIQRSRSSAKPSDSLLLNPPCRITMVYYGPHAKLDYDHSLFEPVDEVIVMQQHCGGENLIVYKDKIKPGDQFTFNSRRHLDYPFGLSLYVKGLIDSRISTCCEYKHRHGVRLGGERGHFAIVSVEGSKPCLKCRFEKQSRLRQYGDSPKDFDETEGNKQKPITISIPISDEKKTRQRSVEIPVRQTSNSNENYAEDFDGSDDTETPKREYSSGSNPDKLKTGGTAPHTRLTAEPLRTPTENSSASTIKSQEKSTTKTWQITFHTANAPNSSFELPKSTSITARLKFSFLSADGKDETEVHEINMGDFSQCFKSGRQDSFRVKLRNIGTPQRIRLILEIARNDDDKDDDEDIKWRLDHIELIDPKTLSHYNFPYNEWIRPSEENILNFMDSSSVTVPPKASKKTTNSKSASSSTTDKKSSPKRTTNATKTKASARSSSSSVPSSYESPKRFEQIQKTVPNAKRRISTDSESTNDKHKVRYRVNIYTSKTDDGEFNASSDSQIFMRLNNQTKKSFILNKITKMCPSFDPDENQSFEVDLMQNSNEKPTKLTIGYYNSDIAAGKWKLDKIILTNVETGQETTFICKDALLRNDYDLQAEKTFSAQTKQSDDNDDDEKKSTPRNFNGTKRVSQRSGSEESVQEKQIQLPTKKRNQSTSSESVKKETPKAKSDRKTSSVNSSRSLKNSGDDDEDNEYNKEFKLKGSNNESKFDSSPSRPKTRRGLQNGLEKNKESDDTNNTSEKATDIWRPASELDTQEPVDPLVGLDDLQDQTSRSNNLKTQNSLSSTDNNKTNVQFKTWYTGSSDEDKKN